MAIPLTDAELVYLLNFIGCGRLDGGVWLMCMEEAGGGEDNNTHQAQFRPVEDNAAGLNWQIPSYGRTPNPSPIANHREPRCDKQSITHLHSRLYHRPSRTFPHKFVQGS